MTSTWKVFQMLLAQCSLLVTTLIKSVRVNEILISPKLTSALVLLPAEGMGCPWECKGSSLLPCYSPVIAVFSSSHFPLPSPMVLISVIPAMLLLL